MNKRNILLAHIERETSAVKNAQEALDAAQKRLAEARLNLEYYDMDIRRPRETLKP